MPMPLLTVIQAIRTAIFYLLFIGNTTICAIIAGSVGVFRARTSLGWAIARYWCASSLVLLRIICGVRTEVEGVENLPKGGCIIGSKHQSDWDIFAIFPYLDRPAYIAKKELINIPFFGWAARSLDCIEIDRKRGAQAIPQMLAQARDAAKRGCQIVIYPEGTRKAAFAPPEYRQGIVRMYNELDVPVVPVALNSGLYWGRNSPIIWPGTARARFLPAIAPGLSSDVFTERLRSTVERESNLLLLEAVDSDVKRPYDAPLLDRIAAVRQTLNH